MNALIFLAALVLIAADALMVSWASQRPQEPRSSSRGGGGGGKSTIGS